MNDTFTDGVELAESEVTWFSTASHFWIKSVR